MESWPDRRREKRLARLIGLLRVGRKACFVSSALKVRFLGELKRWFLSSTITSSRSKYS